MEGVKAMPDRFTGIPSGSRFLSSAVLCFALIFFQTIAIVCAFTSASAEVRVVTSRGEYRMGDRDTKEDAVRLATEAAKRHALEQVATYLESITIVEGVDVTKDEIRTYTAGLVLVLEQQTNLALDADTVVVTVDLTAQVDTDQVAQAIVALRENEEARHQLAALREEIDSLQQDLESANQALALAATADQVEQAGRQRQEILNRVQSNAMVSQAWTDWVILSPGLYSSPWVGGAQTHALLNVARGLYPASPYVQAAQQVIMTGQPPPSSQPPAPPQQATSRPAPLTLNEISHTTPTTPPHLGNQPAGVRQTTAPPVGSRTLTDIRQLNPLLPPPNIPPAAGQPAAPSGARSARALRQFLQPPAAIPQAGQPAAPGRLPPTINPIPPPTPRSVPRAPSQIAPRGSGSVGHFGGARGGGTAGANGRGSGQGR